MIYHQPPKGVGVHNQNHTGGVKTQTFPGDETPVWDRGVVSKQTVLGVAYRRFKKDVPSDTQVK